jgi:D-alanyl-D-alanine carboxypeptidase/D-alanyl-D-alanine-endopeptidase (penicillin-binding protein 4)
MKTGTLKRVKNIGGYVKSKNGRLYTVVILVNTKKGNWRASALQNNIMKWLVTYKGRGVAQRSVTKDLTTSNAGQQVSSAYYIQTGSFSHAPTSNYLSKISALGMTYRTESNGNYKVLVGPYASESSARTSLKKVRKNINKNAFLVSKTESSKEESVMLY